MYYIYHQYFMGSFGNFSFKPIIFDKKKLKTYYITISRIYIRQFESRKKRVVLLKGGHYSAYRSLIIWGRSV